MAHQSLYRRYRPSRFEQLIGQDHVIATLRNAVRDQKVGHAYLFSGPRGTGKTSTARILAKALNCLNLAEGEPCEQCESCESFAAGASYDLHELDAASNNKVDDMRDLISKVSFGTSGHKKVYVLDEVHMLTTGAENALLKTLEEPPEHVTFIMCTTEPHKVADTVRSRAQRLQFELVPAELMAEHVRWIAADAGFELGEQDANYAIKEGKGSVRDTLSALDQIVSAAQAPSEVDRLEALLDALGAGDLGAALVAVESVVGSGAEPRVLAEELVGVLRNVFLTKMGVELDHLLPHEVGLVRDRGEQLSAVMVTAALKELGEALVRMRQSTDARIDLELAFIRLLGQTEPAATAAGAAAAPPPPRETRMTTAATAAPAGPPERAPEPAAPPPPRETQAAPEPSAAAQPAPESAPTQSAPADAPPERAPEPAAPAPPPDTRSDLTPGAKRRQRKAAEQAARQAAAQQADAQPSAVQPSEPQPAEAEPQSQPARPVTDRSQAAQSQPNQPQPDEVPDRVARERAEKAEAVGVSVETLAHIEKTFPNTKAVPRMNSRSARASANNAPPAQPVPAPASEPAPPAPQPEPEPQPPAEDLSSMGEDLPSMTEDLLDLQAPPEMDEAATPQNALF